MQVIIENQRQKINLESKTVNIDFDVKKGEYISCVSVKNSYKTKIFSYSDFSLFVCILFKNNCKNLRFVMFNLKKQKAFIVFEVKYSNNLLFKRINETSFLLVEQLKKESVMHLCFFKENKKNNKVLHIGKVKRICVLQKQKIVVHSIQNNMEKIVIYNLNGEVCKIVFCENIFKINKIKFEFLDNYILVKDFNEEILLKKDLSEIIKNN